MLTAVSCAMLRRIAVVAVILLTCAPLHEASLKHPTSTSTRLSKHIFPRPINPKPPLVDIDFSVEPRLDRFDRTFGWSSGSDDHTGVVTFDSARRQHLPLTADIIAAFGGAVINNGGSDRMLTKNGASGGGNGSGWTIECVFSARSTALFVSAALYEFSDARHNDMTVMLNSTSDTTASITVTTSSPSARASFSSTIPMTALTDGWSDLVITIEPLSVSTAPAFLPAGAIPPAAPFDAVYTLYLNGVLVCQSNGVFMTRALLSQSMIGHSALTPKSYFDGAVDALRIFDYVYSPETIQQLTSTSNSQTQMNIVAPSNDSTTLQPHYLTVIIMMTLSTIFIMSSTMSPM